MAGKPITRFEAPRLVGPQPSAGRVVERVESHGRQLDIVWDDGLVLHTHMRRSNGSWHLYRQGDRWRESVSQMRVEIHTDQWLAVCFGAPVVETYRQFDRSRHPGFGPLGPELCRPEADLDESINRLYHYHDQDASVAEALLDEHVARNVGNVYRCEALWACALHPFATVSSLDGADCANVIVAAASLVRAHVHQVDVTPTAQPARLAAPPAELDVYGRNGQPCARCGDTIHVCRSGDHAHLLYWCPGCQVWRSPFVAALVVTDESREMDPHPAAAQFLSQLPWRRNDPLAG